MTKLSQHEDLSSHWTIALSSQGYLLLIFLITVLHLVLSPWVPLTNDEVYYWNWAQQLNGGYLDGPPMVAYWIAFSTSIFGNNPFGIRFTACFAWLIVLWILGSMVRRKFVLTLFAFTPLLMLYGMHMGPEIPLVFFWTLYLVWLRHINVVLSGWEADPVSRVYKKNPIPALQWVVGGCLLGLGTLSQYTMLFVVPCTLLLLLVHFRFQAWILGFVGQLLIASLVCVSLLRYNQLLHFEPFLRHWNAALISQGFSVSRFFSNIWLQTILMGAAPMLLLPWVLLRPRGTSENPALNAHFYLYILPALWFGYKAFNQDIDPLWPLVASLAFWCLAQRVIDGSSFQGAVRGLVLLMFLPAWMTTALSVVHPSTPWQFIARDSNESESYFEDPEFQQRIESSLSKDIAVFSLSRPLTARLRYKGFQAYQFAHAVKKSQFSIEAVDPCSFTTIFVATNKPVPSAWVACFSSEEIVKTHSSVIGGKLFGTLDIVKYSK